MLDEVEEAFDVHPLNLYSYQREDIYAKVDTNVYSKNSLQYIDKAHCSILGQSISKYQFSYMRFIMSLYFSPPTPWNWRPTQVLCKTEDA